MAGSRLKEIMARLTGNRLRAVATGCLATAVLQSSSITTVIAIGFVSAGIISLSQALGITMGAAVGTTITAQIIAFKVTHYALLLIALGFICTMWRSRATLARLGSMLMGLGVIFLGLDVMSTHMAPLRSYQPFIDLMAGMSNPLLGIVIAAVFTALVQSSSATLGVIIVLAGQGLIPLDAGLALVFGANIGTTITALLASIGQPKSAFQTALSYLVFKVIMVAIWLPLIGPLESLTRAISPVATDLEGAAALAFEVPRQVANAHTLINLLTVAVVLPFTGLVSALVIRLTGPETQPSADEPQAVAKELNPILIDQPALAAEAMRREVTLMGAQVLATVEQSLATVISGDAASLDMINGMDGRIDAHHEALVAYCERLLQVEMASEVGMEITYLLETADYLESIGDVVAKDMVPLGRRRLSEALEISPSTHQHLAAFHRQVVSELERGIQAVAEQDLELARSVVKAKASLREAERRLIEHQIERLTADAPKRVAAYTVERDLAESLRRIYSLTRRFIRAGCQLHRRRD